MDAYDFRAVGTGQIDSLRLQQLLEETCRKSGIPGLSVSLFSHGRHVSAAVGVASASTGTRLTTDSMFQLGCITKLVTSLLAAQLAHAGLLNLEAPLAEYLVEFRKVTNAREVQVQHLASHTSGYQGLNIANPAAAYFYSWKKFTSFFRETPKLFSPGTVFNYEHTECVLLGEIIRRLTGTPVHRLMCQLVFEPLGIAVGRITPNTSQRAITASDHGFDTSSGRYQVLRSVPYCSFWASSLSDFTVSITGLMTLARALIGKSDSTLPRQATKQCQEQVIRIPNTIGGSKREHLPLSFGKGCAQYAGRLLGHNGSSRGQTCAIRFDPVNCVIAVVAINAWQPYVRDWLLSRLLHEHRPPAASSVEQSEAWTLEELEGNYVGCVQGANIIVRRRNDYLECFLANRSSNAQIHFTMQFDGAGRLLSVSELHHLSVGLFRDPTSGRPCMMLGMNAFKRELS